MSTAGTQASVARLTAIAERLAKPFSPDVSVVDLARDATFLLAHVETLQQQVTWRDSRMAWYAGEVERLRQEQARLEAIAMDWFNTFKRTEQDRDAALAAHMELVMAVSYKYPGETRHQTALRYIVERETPDPNAIGQAVSIPKAGDETGSAALHPDTGQGKEEK